MAQAEAIKPAALAIYSKDDRLMDVFMTRKRHVEVQDFRGIDFSGNLPGVGPKFHHRLYPLRLPLAVGDDPTREDWRASSLEGIWLGPYSVHGTEVLYVYVDETSQEVRAMKITGDMNVPRGAVSWGFRLEHRLLLRELPQDAHGLRQAFADVGGDSQRIYRGWGAVSGHGYRCAQNVVPSCLYSD